MLEPFDVLYEDADLEDAIFSLAGSEYRLLVQAHMRRGKEALSKAVQGNPEVLTDEEWSVAEGVIAEFSTMANSEEFWGWDCSDVLEDISDTFEAAMEVEDLQTDDATKYHVCQSVTVWLAWTALNQESVRKLAAPANGIFLGH